MTYEALSADAHIVPRQKAAGVSRSTQQGPEAAPGPRRRREQGRSTKCAQQLSERTSTAEEREEGSTSSSSGDGIVQEPFIRRMQLTRESYGEFEFDIDLVFRHKFPAFEPCGISLAESAKPTTLSEGTVAKLKLRVDAIKDHLSRFTQEERMDQEVNLLRKSSTFGIRPFCRLICAMPQGAASPAAQGKIYISTRLADGKNLILG